MRSNLRKKKNQVPLAIILWDERGPPQRMPVRLLLDSKRGKLNFLTCNLTLRLLRLKSSGCYGQ